MKKQPKDWTEMERHPEWFDRKSTSSGFAIYWGIKLKEVM